MKQWHNITQTHRPTHTVEKLCGFPAPNSLQLLPVTTSLWLPAYAQTEQLTTHTAHIKIGYNIQCIVFLLLSVESMSKRIIKFSHSLSFMFYTTFLESGLYCEWIGLVVPLGVIKWHQHSPEPKNKLNSVALSYTSYQLYLWAVTLGALVSVQQLWLH